jgi:hypothetical protein
VGVAVTMDAPAPAAPAPRHTLPRLGRPGNASFTLFSIQAPVPGPAVPTAGAPSDPPVAPAVPPPPLTAFLSVHARTTRKRPSLADCT